MKRSRMQMFTAGVIVIVATWAGAASAAGLTELLMSGIGVTRPQAVGGAGSIFKYAKGQMTTNNFGRLAAVVPGMKTYLAAAPKVVAPTETAGDRLAGLVGADSGGQTGRAIGGLAGDAENLLGQNAAVGAVANKLGSLEALVPAFRNLGLKPAMVSRFVPVVVNYVKTVGGSSTAKLLSGALGL